MPKLNAKTRKKVDKSEAVAGGGFEPLPAGKYIAELSDVEAKTSQAGNDMWNCTFTEIHDLDGERQPGRQWYTLMMPIDEMPADYTPKNSKKSPEEAWESYQDLVNGRLKAFFEAFGFTTDTDTDELIGERVVIQLGIETIQSGPRTGEKTNRVNGVFPLDSVDFEDSDGEDEF